MRPPLRPQPLDRGVGRRRVSPFLASAAGIGYETKAYVWVGYGVWTQLWASWTLPLAWGFTYRALSSLRFVLPAVFFIMLTVALHYETGYLAFVPLVVWPFLVPSDLWRRLGRAVVVGGCGAAGVGLGHRPAAGPVALGGAEPGARGDGARERLRRPADAQLALHRHSSTTTGAWSVGHHDPRGVGIGVCIWRWRTHVAGRALVTIWVVTLLMTFGRTTWGALYDIVPGSSDVFIRRFQMGVQLSGILLAGIGIVFLGRLVLDGITRLLPEERRGWAARAGVARRRRRAVHRRRS